MATLQITGRTREIKKTLKAAGWKWRPGSQSWGLEISDADAADLRGERATMVATLQRLGAWKKCCAVHLDGKQIWADKGFADYISDAEAREAGRDPYNLDAAGNPCYGRRIPGSVDDYV